MRQTAAQIRAAAEASPILRDYAVGRTGKSSRPTSWPIRPIKRNEFSHADGAVIVAAMPMVAERPPDVRTPHFGAAYDKARRSYGLASAVLLAWELIGIQLDPAPVQSFKVTLQSPQAAPYVLLALVIYFAIRLTIEWFQTDTVRRQMFASRADFVLAHIIGTAALGLYAAQTLLRIQVVNKITLPTVVAFTLALFTGLAVGMLLAIRVFDEEKSIKPFLNYLWEEERRGLVGIGIMFASGIGAIIASIVVSGVAGTIAAALGNVFGALFGFIAFGREHWRSNRSRVR